MTFFGLCRGVCISYLYRQSELKSGRKSLLFSSFAPKIVHVISHTMLSLGQDLVDRHKVFLEPKWPCAG